MNPNDLPRTLESAELDWQDGTPVSVRFDDVYFSREDGTAETQYVFLEQNDLPQRWEQWQTPGSFTIAETGFGTGLNFFCACALWKTLRKPGQHLHFVSVEQFPLQLADLEKACALRPAFASLAAELLHQYPPLVSGLHRLHFLQDNITLTLIFAEATAGFAGLEASVDAWFLDGFAPSRNPAMWQPALFAEMARISHEGTTFATFTSAGLVKRGLRDAGFAVEKHPGYGRKRDMLKGQFSGTAMPSQWLPAAQPWFRFQSRSTTPGHAAIIGAGLAGCCTANALARRGWKVTVLERENQIASQASSNATGITYVRLSNHNTPQNRWYLSGYLHACRFIRATFEALKIAPGTDWNLNGVFHLAHNDEEVKAQQELQASGCWPASIARFMDAKSVSEVLGFTSEFDGLLMPQGGWLNPATLCKHLLQHPAIEVRTDFAVSSLERQHEHWYIAGTDTPFDAVVFANTFDAANFACADHLPLRWVRGQITHVPATEPSQQLKYAVNYDGYINPARDGFHCVGTTFQPRDRECNERIEDHQHNLDQLRLTLPTLSDALSPPDANQISGKVGFRCQTPDYLPLAGPLPDTQAFNTLYAELGKGGVKHPLPPCPNLPGLFITTAFGSKGLTAAPLAAEVLVAYITGEPQPVDRETLFALHPARFLQRTLKRRT